MCEVCVVEREGKEGERECFFLCVRHLALILNTKNLSPNNKMKKNCFVVFFFGEENCVLTPCRIEQRIFSNKVIFEKKNLSFFSFVHICVL